MVDSDSSSLTIYANNVSVSLMQHTQITVKDAMLQLYKLAFCFKHWTCLHILPWQLPMQPLASSLGPPSFSMLHTEKWVRGRLQGPGNEAMLPQVHTLVAMYKHSQKLFLRYHS